MVKKCVISLMLLGSTQLRSGIGIDAYKIIKFFATQAIPCLDFRRIAGQYQAKPVTPHRALHIAINSHPIGNDTSLIQAHGSTTTVDHQVNNFSEILLCIPGNITLQQGDRDLLAITAHKDLLPHLTWHVAHNKLVLDMKPGTYHCETLPNYLIMVNGNRDTTLTSLSGGNITLHNFKTLVLKLLLSGKTICKAEHLNVDYLKVTARLYAIMELQGKTHRQKLDLSDVCIYHARNLKSDSVEINATGMSKAKVYAQRVIQGSLSDTSDLTVYGNPEVMVAQSYATSIHRG